ncbi:MAG: hypothetical protein O2944_00180 [Proteobacteria bacterium]|nr:hypothetical protein [Pseudomonadota bacterium]
MTSIDNSTGVILPKEILARQMEAGEKAMRTYRDVLRKLAK